MKAIIFDLDQTLINSQSVEYLRRQRDWSSVYKKIPTISVYGGINEVLSFTKEIGLKISIASSSPSSYVQRVIQHFNWSFDAVVCYHDTNNHKPHPDPLIEASNRLMINIEDCWAVGDHPNDIIAAKRAGMYSIGALWGSIDRVAVKSEKPDMIFNAVEDFTHHLMSL